MMASRSMLRQSNKAKSLILTKIRSRDIRITKLERIFKTTSARGLQSFSRTARTLQNNNGTKAFSTREEEISYLAVAAFLAAASVPFLSDVSPLEKKDFFDNRLRTKCEVSVERHRSVRPGAAPKNIMLRRMRSLRERDMVEKYDVDWKTVLGEGAYGKVHPARLTSTKEKVALKKIPKRFTDTLSFRTETDALVRIFENGGHPNISGLRDIYEDYEHFYLILDLVSGGEMFDNLINFGAYSEADAARLMREVASALAFLHGVGVVHADLKPENLLLDQSKRSTGTVKIIDFGCALINNDIFHDYDPKNAQYDDQEMRPKGTIVKNNGEENVASTGTMAYWAPERFKGSVNAATDLWSLGNILFIMLSGAHPFDLEGMSTDDEIKRKIQEDPSPPIGQLTNHLTQSAVDLIQKLMEKDPEKRLTADEMLQHPWIRGETATTDIMAGSDKKLINFKELRHKLEAGIFAVLVEHGHRDKTLSEVKHECKDDGHASVDIMKRAFQVFDNEGKGFVSSDDLGRVVSEATGSELSTRDRTDMMTATGGKNNADSGLSLSDFSKLFSKMKHKHFPRGHVIFRAGDDGQAMYFLNSGKVEVRTKKGQHILNLRPGDFFGEGSLLVESNKRFTTTRCTTPVDVIEITREEFDRYIKSSSSVKDMLKVKWRARSLAYAKNLVRLQKNVKKRIYKKGDVIYREGDVGKSMYRVDENDGGKLDVIHDGAIVHSYFNEESFGESSLLFERPRSSTVICSSETCKLHEMVGSDFLAVVESDRDTAANLKDMCRKRLFKKAIKKFSREQNRGFYTEDLVKVFQEVDKDDSGNLTLDEVRDLMHKMDPDFPETEIVALLKFLDVDGDGKVGLVEFKRMFRCFDKVATKKVKKHIYKKGDFIYKEGDVAKSMYRVDEIDGGKMDVIHDGVIVHSYINGQSFGESSLLFERPRSSTVICSSETCKLHKMGGSDFLAHVKSDPETSSSLKEMCRKRLFKKATRKLQKRGFYTEDLVKAFQEIDKDDTGSLMLGEVRDMLRKMDPAFTDTDIMFLQNFLDVAGDGKVCLEVFEQMFQTFEKTKI